MPLRVPRGPAVGVRRVHPQPTALRLPPRAPAAFCRRRHGPAVHICAAGAVGAGASAGGGATVAGARSVRELEALQVTTQPAWLLSLIGGEEVVQGYSQVRRGRRGVPACVCIAFLRGKGAMRCASSSNVHIVALVHGAALGRHVCRCDKAWGPPLPQHLVVLPPKTLSDGPALCSAPPPALPAPVVFAANVSTLQAMVYLLQVRLRVCNMMPLPPSWCSLCTHF